VQSGDEGERAAVLVCELLRQYDLSTRAIITGDEQVTEYVRDQTNVHVLTVPIKNELMTYKSFQKILLGNLYTNIDFQYVEISADEINNFTPRLIQSLQNRNVCVFLSDVNTEEDYRTAIELGVDGVITDDPELIAELLETDAQLITDDD
jgi:glycerophosphoryl diester phosphodiesterase